MYWLIEAYLVIVELKQKNNYLLESLAACHDSRTKLVIYFTVNLAFTNYINDFNLTEEINIPTIINKSTSEVTLPVFLNKSKFDEIFVISPTNIEGIYIQVQT